MYFSSLESKYFKTNFPLTILMEAKTILHHVMLSILYSNTKTYIIILWVFSLDISLQILCMFLVFIESLQVQIRFGQE